MKEPIIVLTFRGKGKGTRPDYVMPKLFKDVESANEYISIVTNLDDKYWTYAEIVKNGEEIEPFNE